MYQTYKKIQIKNQKKVWPILQLSEINTFKYIGRRDSGGCIKEALKIKLSDGLEISMMQQNNQMNKVRGNITSGEICVFQLLAWLADLNIMLKSVSLLVMVTLQKKDMLSLCGTGV